MIRRLSFALPLVLLAASAVVDAAIEARTVRYAPRDVIRLNCRLRHTTLVVLPAGEKILDYVIGDKDMWLLEGTERYAYVKPAREGSATTINLITQVGNVYTFLAEEGAKDLDLKVFVELSDPSQFQPVNTAPRYVPAEEADALRARVEALQADQTKALENYASEYPLKVAFEYQFALNRKPFFVSSIWHDDRATYIRSNAREKPTLYELQDGKPVLINYELRDNVYIVPKVLDEGQLKIGTKAFDFKRR